MATAVLTPPGRDPMADRLAWTVTDPADPAHPATPADEAVDWLLRYFAVAPVGRTELLRARALGSSDFEDAVVAAGAEAVGREAIVTRNVRDFAGSPVPAVTPEEYLLQDGGPD